MCGAWVGMYVFVFCLLVGCMIRAGNACASLRRQVSFAFVACVFALFTRNDCLNTQMPAHSAEIQAPLTRLLSRVKFRER